MSPDVDPPAESDRYRNEPMALAARPSATFVVQIRDADRETFREAKAWNSQVKGMVSLTVRNDAGELLFIHNEPYGGWVFPGGCVEDDESYRAAAIRETREESGIEARVVGPLAVYHVLNRHDGKTTDGYLVQFEGEALATEPASDPGEQDENITDVAWFDSVPTPLADDPFVRQTTRNIARRLDCQT